LNDLVLTSLKEHEAIERWLDRLVLSLRKGVVDAGELAAALDLAVRHYSREESTLFAAARAAGFAAVVKLEEQHSEPREIGSHAQSSETPGERLRLARRFHAIAQHNIIEEERDFFPLLLAQQALEE
jgi:hypothetical protein